MKWPQQHNSSVYVSGGTPVRNVSLWRAVLGVDRRTVIERVEFDEEADAVVAHVRSRRLRKRRCGRCGRRAAGYDQGEGRRRWRALDLGELRSFLEADAPRVDCPEHGPTVIQVPWARHAAGHTRAFDDTVAWLAVHTSKTAIVELVRIAWATVGAIVARVVDEARAAVDPFDGLRRVGIDEISYKRGHRYLTVVVDHDTGRLVWAAKGHDKKTLEGFFDLLGGERCAIIRLVSCRRGRVDRRRGQASMRERDGVSRRLPSREVGDRSARRRSPRDVERRPPVRDAHPRPGSQARPLCAVEEPRGPHRPPGGEAGLGRHRQPPPLSRLPAERGTAARVRRRGRAAVKGPRRWISRGPDAVASPPSSRSPGASSTPRHPSTPPSSRLVQRTDRITNTKIRVLTRVAFGFHSPDALIGLAMLALGGPRPYCRAADDTHQATPRGTPSPTSPILRHPLVGNEQLSRKGAKSRPAVHLTDAKPAR